MDIKTQAHIIACHETIYAALEKLNQPSILTLFVIDKSNKLVGSLTDGDIRRALLRGVKTEDCCTQAMNNCRYHIQYQAANNANDTHTIPCDITDIPVIDKYGTIKSIIRRQDLNTCSGLRCSFIFAGGKGTRLLPLTKTIPKPLIMLGNKPILQHIIEQHVSAGITDIYISVNYLGQQICSYFGDGTDYNCRITYLYEDKELGTAGSLSLLPADESRDILITNGDVITNLSLPSLWDFHNAHKNEGTVCIRRKEFTIPFGIIHSSHAGELLEIQEKPSLPYDVNAAIYLLTPSIYRLVNEQKYLDMPELLNLATSSNATLSLFPIYEDWFDVGQHETLKEARQSFI